MNDYTFLDMLAVASWFGYWIGIPMCMAMCVTWTHRYNKFLDDLDAKAERH